MADAQKADTGLFRGQRNDVLIAAGVIAVVMMMLIPMPSFLLDTLMSANLVASLLIVLIVLYTKQALDFSVFPTLLLVVTVFGLALNVSSTRLILSQGSEFDGKLVRAFGRFVTGSSGTEGLVIGIIIFLIIIAVQFIVITKGATRVSEVAARFTLDALPGKQMAIEAEYNSGLITEEETRRKKAELQDEVSFYGAMDGASKFVSGNVKVGILITMINVVGGFIVGMTIHNEPAGVAFQTYVSLTIGDGLVTQFPALLISTATGLIVTRAVSDGTFGADMALQFSKQSKIYWIGAGFLFAIAFLPGFPWYVLLPMSGMMGLLAYRLSRKEQTAAQFEHEREAQEEAQQQQQPAEVSPVVPLDPLALELGYGLIPLVDKEKGAELLERITRIRRESALDLGLVVPPIRIIDNMRLEPSEYSFKIKGTEVGRAVIRPGQYLCINPGGEKEEIPGEKTKDPAFALPATWITEEYRDQAERAGYTVVDAPSVIATHMTEIIKSHASEILGRQEVKSILDTLRKDYPAVVEEVTSALSNGIIQKTLQNLLNEQVSIRNMVMILETLADYGGVSKDVGFLTEKVRQTLGRQMCMQYTDEDGVLRVLTVEPGLEQRIIDSRVDTAMGAVAALEPEEQRSWLEAVTSKVREVQQQGLQPVVLTSEAARPLVKTSTRRDIPHLTVLSIPEIASDVRVESLGEIKIEET
ncbi:MAG: flagellar biosynthesis protein FlhA [Spirochaetales bacterium]|nr:flagellar biosynthesis protein FlhA [Spirochaetales bacterium]MCF7937597.1 flagellar biosynthesis protein FlhA [Spirochaetales bacterium]